VTAVEMTTRSGVSHSVGSPGLVKPLPWTPIQPFVHERKLSNYSNKAFVRWLIDKLQHGFAIGYVEPQFTCFANNLRSAFQQPEIIDAALKRQVWNWTCS